MSLLFCLPSFRLNLRCGQGRHRVMKSFADRLIVRTRRPVQHVHPLRGSEFQVIPHMQKRDTLTLIFEFPCYIRQGYGPSAPVRQRYFGVRRNQTSQLSFQVWIEVINPMDIIVRCFSVFCRVLSVIRALAVIRRAVIIRNMCAAYSRPMTGPSTLGVCGDITQVQDKTECKYECDDFLHTSLLWLT